MNRIFKTVTFNRWMRKSKLADNVLYKMVLEMSNGLIDAELGKGLYKKRVALPGHGKRSGARTLLATNRRNRWVFLFGFQKNERENITNEELEVLQGLSSEFLAYSEKQLDQAVSKGKLLEVFCDDKT